MCIQKCIREKYDRLNIANTVALSEGQEFTSRFSPLSERWYRLKVGDRGSR